MGLIDYEIFKKNNPDLSSKDLKDINTMNDRKFKWKRVSKLFNVKKLDSSLSSAMYYGFNVTPYQYYGTNVSGTPVVINASMSGYGCIKVFTRRQGIWTSEFIPFEYLEKFLPTELVDEIKKEEAEEELQQRYL